MARIYDDISHLRQPYLQTRLGGPQDEAEGLGVYMTSGPVDAAPLPVHTGFGVYSGPVDAAPLPIQRGFGAATLASARFRAPAVSRPRPAGGSMHYPVRPHVPARTSSMHYPVRPHIPPAVSYGARMGGAVPMPAPPPEPSCGHCQYPYGGKCAPSCSGECASFNTGYCGGGGGGGPWFQPEPAAGIDGLGAVAGNPRRVTRAPTFNRPRPAGSMHYPVRPHIPPAASYGARMGGAVPMPAPAPQLSCPNCMFASGGKCVPSCSGQCASFNASYCGGPGGSGPVFKPEPAAGIDGLGSGEMSTTTSVLYLGALAALGIWAATRR